MTAQVSVEPTAILEAVVAGFAVVGRIVPMHGGMPEGMRRSAGETRRAKRRTVPVLHVATVTVMMTCLILVLPVPSRMPHISTIPMVLAMIGSIVAVAATSVVGSIIGSIAAIVAACERRGRNGEHDCGQARECESQSLTFVSKQHCEPPLACSERFDGGGS